MSVPESSKRLWLMYNLRGGVRPSLSQSEIDEIEYEWSDHTRKLISESKKKIDKSRKIYFTNNRPENDKLVPTINKNGNLKFEWYSRSKPRQKDSWKSYSKRYNIPDNNIEVKWETYAEYCLSREFNKWKKKVLRRFKNKCVKCGKEARVAHHVKYRKWGTEKTEDGLALCNICHWNLHGYTQEEIKEKIKSQKEYAKRLT